MENEYQPKQNLGGIMLMKINDLVVLKKDTVNSYRNWDKGEALKVVNFRTVIGEQWVTLQDVFGDELSTSIDNVDPLDIGNLIELEVDNRTLDEKLNSPEFRQALEQNDFSSVNKIFNNTPSGNSLADTGRFPQ